MKHVNASEVLPPDLLRMVQKHCSGYIYVPSSRAFWHDRRSEVLRLHSCGLGTAEIAGRVHLCVRRVQQIVRVAAAQSPE
jgi:DNA-binding NarL/FixJ family response regulator